MEGKPELISPKELARELKVSKPLPYQWAKKGLIPFYRIGKVIRFDMDDVKKFLEKNRVEP